MNQNIVVQKLIILGWAQSSKVSEIFLPWLVRNRIVNDTLLLRDICAGPLNFTRFGSRSSVLDFSWELLFVNLIYCLAHYFT